MRALRALQKRVGRIERAATPQLSPFELAYGSFDLFVERAVLPGYLDGTYDQRDMTGVIAALRAWEGNGIWAVAYAG